MRGRSGTGASSDERLASGDDGGSAAGSPGPSRRGFATLALHGSGFFSLSLQPTYNLLVPLWALHLGASPLTVGLAVGASSVIPFLLAVQLGGLADRWGGRRLMIRAALLAMAVGVLYPLVPRLSWLIGVQALQGVFAGGAWIGSQTYVATASRDADMHGVMSRFSFVVNLGTAAGPFVAGWVAQHFGFPVAFELSALWAGGLALCAWGLPPARAAAGRSPGAGAPAAGASGAAESPGSDTGPRADSGPDPGVRAGAAPGAGPAGRAAAGTRPRGDFARMRRLVVEPAVTFVLLGTFVRLAVYGVRGSIYPLLLTHIGLSTFAIGTVVAAGSAASTVTSLLAGRLTRRLAAPHVLALGLAVGTLGIAAAPALPAFSGEMALAVISGAGVGLSLPLLLSILAVATPPADRGLAISIRQAVNRLCSASLPVLLGLLARDSGLGVSFYVAGAGLLLVNALGLATLRRAGLPGLRSARSTG